MRTFFPLLLISVILFCSCIKKNPKAMSPSELSQAILGEYDNFQQCWQENTEEAIHQVEVSRKHKHIHVAIRKGSKEHEFSLLIYEGRDSSNVIREESWELKAEGNAWKILTKTKAEEEADSIGVKQENSSWILERGEEIWSFHEDSLSIKHLNDETDWEGDHKLLSCRFFSGWITLALSDDPEDTYRMGDLRTHDQGGIVQLRMEDGSPTDYSAEITQLVYGKTISIMKLAIYKEDFAGIDYNSRSISYTWTNPKAKRLGINLRTISSGWTLIEPGYISSNNLNKK